MVKNIYSLTPLQEGILFHSFSKEANESPYFEQISFDVEGNFSSELFKESWNELIKRHDILRTIFIYDQVSEYKQVVLKKGEINLSYQDIVAMGEEQEAYIKRFEREDRERYFELSKENPLRLKVFKVNENVHTIVLSNHHILIDGWSLGVIFEELFTIYSALKAKRAIDLPIAKPYSNYIKWLKKQDMDTTKIFWSNYLEGYETDVLIPKKLNAKEQGYRAKEEKLIISKEQTLQLQKLTQKYAVTTNALIETIWAIVMAKYNNSNDVVFGSTVSGRVDGLEGIDKMVGLFINTIPVRVQFSNEDNFITLLQKVMKSAIVAKDHHHYSLAEIQNLTPLKNNLIKQLMVFENYPISTDEDDTLGFELGNIRNFSQTNYDFLIMIHALETINIEFHYNELLYSKATLNNIKNSFAQVIDAFITLPQNNVSELNIISNEEQNLLQSFNQTQNDYPKNKTIIELFEEQVKKTPNNIAVVYENRELTYEELNQKANQLGHYLRETQNIQADTLMPIMVDRSEWMIIAILGVLKSGGAYLPIDPEYPEDRITYMLEDSKATLVLCDTTNYGKAISNLNALTLNIIDIETFEKENNALSTNLDSINSASNLAYVIYTSGSTGKPKGVMVEHAGVVNRITWMKKEYNLDSNDTILQKTPFSFDVSVWELLLPMIYGTKLVFAKPNGHKDNEYLIELIKKESISFMHFVPSMLSTMLYNKELSNCNSLRNIVCSGEALPLDTINSFYDILEDNNLKLHNLYGPTEASIDVSSFYCDKTKTYKSIPIGKPIANTKLYILDQTQNQLPLGAIGELYIAGDGLARGYLNKPELTKKVFINHPTLGRIYKTGDIAKYQEDGNIEYLGRVDDQVKIRGFRIELGEIENSILSFKGIKEAVVLAKEQQLIAYVVEETKESIEELKAHLKSKLPSYMIPSYFIELESLPLTPNGKIDKKALPSVNEADNHKVYIEASNETEKKLESIFCEVLKVDKVSMDDNFFEVGGHSLTAITTIAKVSKAFSVEIKLKELFIYNSIQGLAKLIASKTKVEHIAILPLEPQESYEVSNAQRRLWVLDKMQDGSNVYNMPEALRFKENINMEVLQESVTRLINRHEILRTNFKERAGEVRQVISKEVNEDIIEVLELKEDEVNDYLLKSATAIFDLEKDALLSLKVINGNILFVNMHHIVSDGWSIAIIVKELSELYTALDNKEEPNLKPLTIHYKEYTAWQNALLKDEAYLEKHQSYWHKALKGHQTLEFPLDHSRPSSQTFEGSHLNFKLNTEQSRKLKSYTKNSTLFTVILTITNILLSKYGNQEDILLGTPIANRGHEQLFDQIGLYVNTLALRTKLDNTKSFEENLSTITEKTLEAFEHQSYPFDKLVDELDLERDLSQNPLFNMMIVLQNNEQSELNFSNNQTELQVIDTKSAKFDMTFNYMEIEEEIVLNIEYNTALFNASTIERLFLNLETLVENISNTTILNELNIISNKEQTLLESLNQTQKEYPKDKTIIELFEEQVKKTPNNIAVVYEERELTYKELNQKANQLGHYLRDTQNIEADTLVPILLDRSEWMIIAILGVLKSGGAYLPIDPEYPEDRIAYMLEDSKATLVLCDTTNYAKAISNLNTLNLNIIDIESFGRENTFPTKNLSIINSASNLAYVIYTSGSTGKPKGVMLTQKNVTSFTANMKEKFNIKERETIYAITTIAFDISVLELISSLLTNLTVIIASSNNLEENIKEIENNPIDIIQTTPTRYNALMDLNPQALKRVNKLLIGGEKLNKEVLSKLQTLDCELYNVYGPTEATVWSTVKRVDMGELNIGKPLCNEMAYILTQTQTQLPLGAIGELYIAGDGLARGYLNQPELTNKVFINHPTLGRIYKTGDIAKYQEDGNIEYLGRVDDQVKIRGFRIELGEIENSILSFKGIKEAVVLAKEQQLIAYVVEGTDLSNDDSKNIIEALKAHLKSKLPSYMIPSYFIELESLPLTPNGKIDKKALPSVNEADNHKVYIEASNETEKKLESIFCEVLKVDKVSMDDNFFEVGGHSLSAIKVISNINKHFNQEISLAEIFKKSSIQELVIVINTIGNKKEKKKDSLPYKLYNEDKKDVIMVFPTMFHSVDDIFMHKLTQELSEYKIYAFEFLEAKNRIEQYCKLLNTLEDEFSFFGYSSGGQLGFEVIKALEKQNLKKPKKLILLDSWKTTELNSFGEREREDMFEMLKEDGLELDNGKMNAFIDMANATINKGVIDMDIALIKAGIPHKETMEKYSQSWESNTSQSYIVYEGFGNHEDMVKDGYITQNSELIKKCLSKVLVCEND